MIIKIIVHYNQDRYLDTSSHQNMQNSVRNGRENILFPHNFAWHDGLRFFCCQPKSIFSTVNRRLLRYIRYAFGVSFFFYVLLNNTRHIFDFYFQINMHERDTNELYYPALHAIVREIFSHEFDLRISVLCPQIRIPSGTYRSYDYPRCFVSANHEASKGASSN